jgi:hypothetical protein
MPDTTPPLLLARAALVAALERARVANGYRTDVGANVDVRPIPGDLMASESLPSVIVRYIGDVSSAEDAEIGGGELCETLRVEWNLVITAEGDDVDSVLILAREDVRDAIKADPSLGGTVLTIWYAGGGISPFEMQHENRGQAVLRFFSEGA